MGAAKIEFNETARKSRSGRPHIQLNLRAASEKLLLSCCFVPFPALRSGLEFQL